MPKKKTVIDELLEDTEEPVEESEKTEEEPKKEEEKEKEKPLEIDTEAIKADLKPVVTEEVTREVIKNITDSLGGNKDDELNAYQKLVKETQEKYHRPPTYDEAFALIEKNVTDKIAADKEKADEEATTERTEQVNNWNQTWDSQIQQLVKEGVVDHMCTPEERKNPDSKDPAAVFERELFAQAKEHNEWNLQLVYYKYMSGRSRQPAGDHEPVSMGKTNVTPKTGYTYEEIHNLGSLEEAATEE